MSVWMCVCECMYVCMCVCVCVCVCVYRFTSGSTQSLFFNSISMLMKNTLLQFERIPTLRLKAMQSLSLETSNFAN